MLLTHACSCSSPNISLPSGSCWPVSPSQQTRAVSLALELETFCLHDQMHIGSCAEACIWMCRFNHLTRDRDLWGEDLCGGTEGKGISPLRWTHCHLWHLSLSTLYLHAIIPLLCFKWPLGCQGVAANWCLFTDLHILLQIQMWEMYLHQ